MPLLELPFVYLAEGVLRRERTTRWHAVVDTFVVDVPSMHGISPGSLRVGYRKTGNAKETTFSLTARRNGYVVDATAVHPGCGLPLRLLYSKDHVLPRLIRDLSERQDSDVGQLCVVDLHHPGLFRAESEARLASDLVEVHRDDRDDRLAKALSRAAGLVWHDGRPSVEDALPVARIRVRRGGDLSFGGLEFVRPDTPPVSLVSQRTYRVALGVLEDLVSMGRVGHGLAEGSLDVVRTGVHPVRSDDVVRVLQAILYEEACEMERRLGPSTPLAEIPLLLERMEKVARAKLLAFSDDEGDADAVMRHVEHLIEMNEDPDLMSRPGADGAASRPSMDVAFARDLLGIERRRRVEVDMDGFSPIA